MSEANVDPLLIEDENINNIEANQTMLNEIWMINNKNIKLEPQLRTEVTFLDENIKIEEILIKNEVMEEESYSCDICDETFTVQSELDEHRLIHTEEDPFILAVEHKPIQNENLEYSCDKNFTSEHHLNGYKRPNFREKSFSCDICKEKFTHLHSLGYHKQIHTGEPLYSCDICNRPFPRKNYLLNHIRLMHDKQRPFSCDMCDKTFTSQNHLYSHERIHVTYL
ncbi:zinc finger protein 429-like [Chrysoperla carnea]|uniref:zinc finger protein 429-like n=1 Tax=Chrysoperla carnea TaxID=189513 RepID=UPI001D07606C|nr:zinc finger protein 429-like [Chrysoperla carnea]